MSSCKVRPNNYAVRGRGDEIIALALGAGVVVCLYDKDLGMGGLSYTLFPNSAGIGDLSPRDRLKYVDSVLDMMLWEMVEAGAKKEAMSAKIIGGARIFRVSARVLNGDIGKRNIEAAREWLREQEILVVGEDTEDDFGRNIRFSLKDGTVEVETVNKYRYQV